MRRTVPSTARTDLDEISNGPLEKNTRQSRQFVPPGWLSLAMKEESKSSSFHAAPTRSTNLFVFCFVFFFLLLLEMLI